MIRHVVQSITRKSTHSSIRPAERPNDDAPPNARSPSVGAQALPDSAGRPSLVRGGQGRDDEEVRADGATAFAIVAIALTLGAIVAALWGAAA